MTAEQKTEVAAALIKGIRAAAEAVTDLDELERLIDLAQSAVDTIGSIEP